MKPALLGASLALALIAYIGVGLGTVDFFFQPQAEVTETSSPIGEPAEVLMPPAERMFPFRWPVGDEPVAVAEARP